MLMALLNPCRTNGALAADSENKPNSRSAASVETSLWTDRYRPKRFIDLLGDEVRQKLPLRRCFVMRR